MSKKKNDAEKKEEYALTLGGIRRPVRFDVDALWDIEEETGLSSTSPQFATTEISVKHTLMLAYHATKRSFGNEKSWPKFKDFRTMVSSCYEIHEIFPIVFHAFAQAWGGDDPKKKHSPEVLEAARKVVDSLGPGESLNGQLSVLDSSQTSTDDSPRGNSTAISKESTEQKSESANV